MEELILQVIFKHRRDNLEMEWDDLAAEIAAAVKAYELERIDKILLGDNYLRTESGKIAGERVD